MSRDNIDPQFIPEKFWDKVKRQAKTAGENVLILALKMYYASTDADTPAWAKTAIYSALGYFILPLDAIPDFAPIVGFSDDLGVLMAAAITTAAHIKDEHAQRAKAVLTQWLPNSSSKI